MRNGHQLANDAALEPGEYFAPEFLNTTKNINLFFLLYHSQEVDESLILFIFLLECPHLLLHVTSIISSHDPLFRILQ